MYSKSARKENQQAINICQR